MADLQIIITGENQSGQAFDTLKRDLGDVGAKADAAKEKGTGFFSGMLQTASGFLAANVLGNIAGQVTSFVSDGIAAAQDTSKLMASTEQTILTMGNAAGRSAQEVADMASALSDAAGKSLFGDDQIQQSENLLLTFGNIKGEVFDTATALTVDLAAALGGAPADQAMMLGKALNDPIKGISALGKAGLTFTEEQKATIKALQEGGDMAGAQAIILEELTKQVGGQAEAQAKAAGGMVQFNARMGEVSEGIGAALLPILNALADMLLTYVAPAIEVAVTWLGENLPTAIAFVSDWLNRIMATFQATGDSSGMLSDVLSFLGEVWELLSDIIKTEVELIKAIVIPIFETIARFISDHGDEIKAVLTAVWTIIKTLITTTLTIIKGVITAALQIIKGDWSGAWETIKQTMSTVWSGIKTIVDSAVTIIKNLLSMAWDAIKGTVTSAWDGIKGAVARAWDGIKSAISDKIDELKSMLQRLPEQANGIGEAIVNTIWNGLKNQWDLVMRWLRDKLADARAIWDDITGGGGGDTEGNATGTRNWRGGLTMVGEFGPELVTLPKGSQIHTNSDTRALLQQSGQMNVHVSFDGRGADLLRQMIRVEVDNIMSKSGNLAYNRMRTGG